MLNTGVRLGEMIALTYGDIDLNKKTVYIIKNVVWIKNRDKDGKHTKGMHPQLQNTTKNGRDYVNPNECDQRFYKDVSTTINIYTHIIKGLDDIDKLEICV